jgi:hypothetical protein
MTTKASHTGARIYVCAPPPIGDDVHLSANAPNRPRTRWDLGDGRRCGVVGPDFRPAARPGFRATVARNGGDRPLPDQLCRPRGPGSHAVVTALPAYTGLVLLPRMPALPPGGGGKPVGGRHPPTP